MVALPSWESQLRDKKNRQNNFRNTNIPVGTNYTGQINTTYQPPTSNNAAMAKMYSQGNGYQVKPAGGYKSLTTDAISKNQIVTPAQIAQGPSYDIGQPIGYGSGQQFDSGYQSVGAPTRAAGGISPMGNTEGYTGGNNGFDITGQYTPPTQQNFNMVDQGKLDNTSAWDGNSLGPKEYGGWDKAKIGVGIGSAVMNGYLGYQSLQETQKQNAFNRDFSNKQLNNQASTIEANVRRRAEARAQRAGKDQSTAGSAAVNSLGLQR